MPTQLLNKDCMEYMKNCGDKFFDLAIVDPPYGIGMSGGNVGYKGNNDLERKDWDNSTPEDSYFEELKRISKNQIIFGGNYFKQLDMYNPKLKKKKDFIKINGIIWDKGEGFYGRTYCECEMAWSSYGKQNIFKHDPLAKRDYIGKIHPTQKPVKLYKWLLKNYAEKGQTILDTHLGSGSSAIAAHYFGCDFTGIEIDEDYFKAAQKRFAHETRQISMF